MGVEKMESQIHVIAALAYLDERLDELQEEFGDLPQKVKEKEEKANSAKALVDETKGILEEIKKFCSTSKLTLIELKNKEEKLTKQQFNVRNNKEFDAITSEIAHVKEEHKNLSAQLRTEGMKEENLGNILQRQEKDFAEAQAEYLEIKAELDSLSNNQDDEVNGLSAKRNQMAESLDIKVYREYERIRTLHNDAAVQIDRNSCSGCFSAVPPQIVVEVRNNLDKVYFCENCGRILWPEEIIIDDEVIETI